MAANNSYYVKLVYFSIVLYSLYSTSVALPTKADVSFVVENSNGSSKVKNEYRGFSAYGNFITLIFQNIPETFG